MDNRIKLTIDLALKTAPRAPNPLSDALVVIEDAVFKCHETSLTAEMVNYVEARWQMPKPLPEQVMYKPLFDLVADQKNWKNPIDAVIRTPAGSEDKALFTLILSRAVTFYVGCVPMITPEGPDHIRVQAKGYYKAVGA